IRGGVSGAEITVVNVDTGTPVGRQGDAAAKLGDQALDRRSNLRRWMGDGDPADRCRQSCGSESDEQSGLGAAGRGGDDDAIGDKAMVACLRGELDTGEDLTESPDGVTSADIDDE